MDKSKTTRFLGLLFTLFILSTILVIIDGQFTFNSSYDIGYAVGLRLGEMLKILGVLSLIVLALNYFKKEALN